MLVEHLDQHRFTRQHFASTYRGFDMNNFGTIDNSSNYAALPYSIFDTPGLFVEAPLEDLKYDSNRSTSSVGSLNPASNHSSEIPCSLVSSISLPSVPSATSSTVGSPYSGHSHTISHDSWTSIPGFGLQPIIANHEGFTQDFISNDFDREFFASQSKLSASFVDPSLIQGPRASYPEAPQAFAEQPIWSQQPQTYQTGMSPAHSPAPSPPSFSPYTIQHHSPQANYVHPQYPYPIVRQPSVSSYQSGRSHQSPMSSDFDDETRDKGRCPHPDCGRVIKDLKAHMLTHLSERPEKCFILHCGYNQKGFARKYDRNRHTLTHYKGTMVCGFCPGSGSASEKSFNRADVFKKHLTTVHGVEQTPPNSRKRSPTNSNKKLSSYCQDATGNCSTCSATFSNAQDFYEHLDDCVLRVVQREEDSEAVNAMLLGKMAGDDRVKQTLERHLLNPNPEVTVATNEDNIDEDDDGEEEDEEEDTNSSFNERVGRGGVRSSKASSSSHSILSGGIRKAGRPSKKGLTRSAGGVALVGKGRKKRKHYPPSWGMSADRMQMKKRVLCVYDGERRLWKDDLMMHNEFEVRMQLPDSKSYVTDLDVETLKRAEAFHNATEEEKGPWSPHHDGRGTLFDLEALMS